MGIRTLFLFHERQGLVNPDIFQGRPSETAKTVSRGVASSLHLSLRNPTLKRFPDGQRQSQKQRCTSAPSNPLEVSTDRLTDGLELGDTLGRNAGYRHLIWEPSGYVAKEKKIYPVHNTQAKGQVTTGKQDKNQGREKRPASDRCLDRVRSLGHAGWEDQPYRTKSAGAGVLGKGTYSSSLMPDSHQGKQ